MREKYIATIIGTGLGDILGKAVEGATKKEIEKNVGKITKPIDPLPIVSEKTGKIKFYSQGLEVGDYTDDTILTVALLRSLAKGKFDIADIAAEQLYEYKIRKLPDGTIIGGFGSTTIKGFINLENGIPPQFSGEIGGPGNAPAMKSAPLGLYIHALDLYPQGLEYAKDVAKITHLDPRSIVSGVIQTHSVYSLLNGVDKKDFIDKAFEICRLHEEATPPEYPLSGKGDMTSRFEWIKNNPGVSDEEAHGVLKSSSLVYQSVPFAYFMKQKYWEDPVKGLIETVNWGGDCDTTGAIYGALTGAQYGMIFPEEWVGVLKGKSEMISLADKVYSLGGKK